MTTTANHEVDDVIIARIQKLLTLAEHDTTNVSEAANAAVMAQNLLDKYNLEMAQVRGYDLEGGSMAGAVDVVELDHTYGPYTSALNKGWQQLMTVVAKQHNCSVILTNGWVRATEAEMKKSRQVRNKGYKQVANFSVIGERVNAETTVTVFDWLRNQLEQEAYKEWPLYRDEMARMGRDPGDPIPFRINFLFGAAIEINRIMTERRQERENYDQITALAVNYEQANQEFISEHYDNLRETRSTQSQANGYAYLRGKEAGERVERSRGRSVTPSGPAPAIS